MNDDAYKKLTAPDGARITYLDTEGDARTTLVFLHGALDNARFWSPVIRKIGRGYRCVAIDVRGHGASRETSGFTVAQYAADVQTVLERLDLESVHLVGHSLGAFTVFEYVSRYGTARLSGIVISDITPKLVSDESWRLGLYRGDYDADAYAKHLQGGAIDIDHETAYFIYRNLTAPPRLGYKKTPPLWSLLVEKWMFAPKRDLLEKTFLLLRDACAADHRATLAKINVQTVIFYANPGSLFTPETASYIAAHIPAPTSLVSFAHTTHYRMLSPPARFARALLRYIERKE